MLHEYGVSPKGMFSKRPSFKYSMLNWPRKWNSDHYENESIDLSSAQFKINSV